MTSSAAEPWRVEDTRALRSWRKACRLLNLPQEDAVSLDIACRRHPLKITHHYLRLLRADKPGGPLRRMLLPDARELTHAAAESADPIGDAGIHQVAPGVIHRHPSRVLLCPTWRCGGYCRYCFRRRRVGEEWRNWRADDIRGALDYIVAHPEIKEAILTGGDPLMLNDAVLLRLLGKLRQLPQLRLLRLHTRMPAFNPRRLTGSLAAGLAALQPLWLVTHFNHPREITPEVERALGRLRRRGVPLLNQSVLLRGVNDAPATLGELCWRLAAAGVKPYYLHHPDRALGTSHFYVSLARGRRLWRDLWRDLPGYLVPMYVLDSPGGGGKAPLVPAYSARAGFVL
ncbi:MAG: KamA family radical SAM protein [Kiritimatiellia bacterium]|nr:KamA family radical SAM protein [Lentisphaerota bacterium]